MMTDIHNLQAFALYMQKTDIKFDLYSVTKEMEKQVDFIFLLFFNLYGLFYSHLCFSPCFVGLLTSSILVKEQTHCWIYFSFTG